MRTNKELWEEAKKDRHVMTGIDHEFVIDSGCKIEMYTNGDVYLYNTMLGGYYYKPIWGEDKDGFYENGFDIQSARLYVRHMKKSLEEMLDRSIERHKEVKTRQDAIDRYIKKEYRYFFDYQRMLKIGEEKLRRLGA